MKRLLAILLLLVALPIRGAVGDPTISINPGGFDGYLWINGGATNGTQAWGVTTNKYTTSTTASLAFSITSPAYNANLTTNTGIRTSYAFGGVKLPGIDTLDTTNIAGITRVHFSLSMPIYADDVNITATGPAGIYSSSTATNVAFAGLAVTNNSTLPYFKVHAMHTTAPNQQMVGNSFRVSLAAFHNTAQKGLPVRGAKLIATGATSGAVVTMTETRWHVDFTRRHALPTGFIYFDVPTTGFTDGESVRFDYVVYPWYGSPSSVLDTRLNEFTDMGLNPRSFTNVCDRTRAVYSNAIAVVASGGSDTSTISTGDPTAVSSGNYFATIAGAINKLDEYNLANYGHNDAGGGIVYVRNGITTWPGGTISGAATTIPRACTTVKAYPGDTVTITTRSGTQDINDRVRFEDLRLEWSGSQTPFNNCEFLVYSNCYVSATAAGNIRNTVLTSATWWIERCTFGAWPQGLRAHVTETTSIMALGCTFTGAMPEYAPTHWIGSVKTVRDDALVFTDYSGMTTPWEGAIWYNAGIYGLNNAGTTVKIGDVHTYTNGMTWAQNIIEKTYYPSANAAASIGSTPTYNYTNLFLANGARFGERTAGFGYNDSGTNAWYRVGWAVLNDYSDLDGNKSDFFGGGGDPNRTGNWFLMYRCNAQGNFNPEVAVNSANGSFPPYNIGPGGFYRDPPRTNTMEFPGFRDRRSYDGTAAQGLGMGDYRLKSDSPQFRAGTKAVLPFDMNGRPRARRDGFDPPGPFVSGNVKRGGFF